MISGGKSNMQLLSGYIHVPSITFPQNTIDSLIELEDNAILSGRYSRTGGTNRQLPKKKHKKKHK